MWRRHGVNREIGAMVLPADLLPLGWSICWDRGTLWTLQKTWLWPGINSRNYRCIYFRVFSSTAAARRNDAVTWVRLCKHHHLYWAPTEGQQPKLPEFCELRDAHRLRERWDDMQAFQTVSITLCHTLPITAHVKCTHKNRHWKAKTAAVSDLTICYLSLHYCAVFTLLVKVISSGHQPHTQNNLF